MRAVKKNQSTSLSACAKKALDSPILREAATCTFVQLKSGINDVGCLLGPR
jgi:hypothetical protein